MGTSLSLFIPHTPSLLYASAPSPGKQSPPVKHTRSRATCSTQIFCRHLKSKCNWWQRTINHFTGFNSHADLMKSLFCLRPQVRYLTVIGTGPASLRNQQLLTQGSSEQGPSGLPEIPGTCTTRPSAHKLPVHDEFLMVLMKLTLGLSQTLTFLKDSVCQKALILISWIKFVCYLRKPENMASRVWDFWKSIQIIL